MPSPGIIRGQRIAGPKLERAKELRREQTPAEQALWKRLRKNQLAGLHFRRQQIIDGFIVDFYCHVAGVFLELDGPIHLQQMNYDLERERLIAAHRLHAVRLKNDEIMDNIESALVHIQTICLSRVH